MLEQVIKRDGTVETANASKINNWMEALSQDIKDRLDWTSVVMEVFKECPAILSTQDLQLALSKKFVSKHSWVSSLMGGRLFAIWHWKNLYGGHIPSVEELHRRMVELGQMVQMDYNEKEYAEINSMIDHQRDLTMAQFQIKQNIYKYGLKDRSTATYYETPQFIYMRMACALSENEPKESRLKTVKAYYDAFSMGKINAPTPNYTNLGTPHRGYASCCLITSGDTAASIAAADHAAYVMTYMSAGIGRFINTRSAGDPVRNGAIEHQGKMPYFEAVGSAVRANLQGGRGGADTEYVSIFDPEIEDVIMAQNPRTPLKKQQRKVHFNVMYNSFFVQKAAKKEKIFTFNTFTAPALMKAFFSKDISDFIAEYERLEADPTFNKNYLNAWDLAVKMETQGHEVSTLYTFDIQRANANTPFKEEVFQSNLCGEIVNVTRPYKSTKDLYRTDHRDGEIGVCNIAAIPVSNIKSDAEYEEIAYLILKMIDNTIEMAHYELPHVGYTSKARRNAAVGMIGVAEYFAARGITYDSPYGLEVAHKLAERHLYYLVKASLRLAKERGVCSWINETKWPEGWMPFDNYKKSLDEIVPNKLTYDWETLRNKIVAFGGIRNSTLVAHMPAESSSKASGTTNGPYPVRELFMKKTDMNSVLEWTAKDDDIYGENYQIAYDIDTVDLIKFYAVLQKFSDQSTSADFYEDRHKNPILSENTLIRRLVARAKYGVVTKYYQNSFTVKVEEFGEENSNQELSDDSNVNNRQECGSGGCTL